MSLPVDVAEPLLLADGTKIDPTSGKVIKDKKPQQFVEIPSASVAQALVARTKKSINELPLPPQNMNALSLVLFYTMWGLSNNDIALVTGLTLSQIKNIKDLEAYIKLQDDLMRSVLEIEATDIRAFFAQKARSAAQKVVDIAEDGEGALAFKASQDILDRAGFRPADVVEHKHQLEGALRIEHIRAEPVSGVPAIDVPFTVIEDGNCS